MDFNFSFGRFGSDLLIGGIGRDFIFGGFGNDRIRAGAEADWVFGGTGNDRIWGNSGNDRLFGNSGHDRIWGGSGSDYVRGGSGNDRLWGNSGNDKLYGDSGHDRIWAGSGSDYVRGGSGNDRIWGNKGNDILHGDQGRDRLYGGRDDDVLNGGSGNDFLQGGTGYDVAVFTGAIENYTITQRTEFEWLVVGRDGRDVVRHVEMLKFDDAQLSLVSANRDPVILPQTANTDEDTPLQIDTLLAGATDPDGDTLEITSVSASASGALVSLTADGNVIYNPNGAFEALAAGETALDTFVFTVSDGNGGTDTETVSVTITGTNDLPTAQNDFANGLADDTLTFNLTGNDSDPDTTDDLAIAALDTTGTLGIVILGADGHSVIYDPNGGFSALRTGETTVDTFSYTVTDGNGGFDTATASVTITGTNDGPFPVDGLASAQNMAVGYTDLQGDQIDGTDGNDDTIFGNGGDDTIYSGLGNDTVDGGAGDDLFQIRLAGPGIDTDVIIGGETDEDGGGDTLDAHSVFRNLTLTLTGAEAGTLQEGAQTTTFSEIERFIFGDGDDTFSGAAFDSAVYVDGYDGADSIVTGNGDDTLMGGFGVDTIQAGNGSNLIDGGDQNDSITSGNGNDTVDGGGNNDTIVSGAGDDSVLGGSGDDNITTGAGSDTVDGGTGNNTINTASGVETADPDDDRDLVNTTSGYNRITTGEGADTINSGDGEDTIDAGSGDDVINAGGDDDSVQGGTGNDSILGGDGQNTIYGGDGNDTLEGGADTDVLRGGANDDLIFGRGGGDRIVDDAGDDTIHGNEGNDSLWGGVGTDSLLGGDDRDQIVYGVSTDAYGDTVDGGTGGDDVDTLDLSRFQQLFRIVGQFLDADGDSTSGTVEFLDGDEVSGLLEFSEIEHILTPAPVAVDDSASVGENDTVATEINLTDNDYEPDFGDTLNIASVDTTGTNGSVTINIDGQTVDYDPNGAFEWLGAGESVIDTFTYTVQDFEGFTDTATVSVTVTGSNDLPTALADSATVGEDDTSPTDINLTGNDIDPDATDVLAIQSVDTTGTLGTVSTNVNGVSVAYNPNGLFDYLALGETAIDTFTYTVSDGNGGTDTETVRVTIHGENDAPVAYDYPTSVNLSEGDVTIMSMSYNDIDPDASDVVEILSIDTTGVLGNVTINPDRRGATYDANGAFDYLGEGEISRETFTYFATDNNGGTDTANVYITIFGTNDGPTAVDDTGSGNETGAINIDLTSNDTDPEVADGLEILSINTTGTLGSVTINADNDSVTYDPNSAFFELVAGETAVDTFTYTIADGNGGTDTAIVSVTLHGVDPDPVDGLETGELMEVGYTDLQGDQIDGPDGLNDIIFGHGGDDTIASGMGRDTVYGGAGDDRFLIVPDGTGIDADQIIGGETDEDDGGDTLDTSAVSRGLRITLTGSEQGTLTYNVAGAEVTNFEEIERFVLGDGGDRFNAFTSSDNLYIEVGAGDNEVSTGFGNDTIIGSNGIGESDFSSQGGNNFIQTGAGDSTVDTGDGNDTVMTASGDDRINTGGGDDSIVGLAGFDVLRSGDGNDTINGGNEGGYIFSSNDFAFSADDKDLITAGRGDDTIFSGWDNDTIMSGAGDDYIEAGEGNDSVNAEFGDDTVLGGDGNDTISGGGDRDSLDGGDGDDTVLGGSGNDTILGGRGRDSLVGGDGNDTFLFTLQEAAGDTVEGGEGYDILNLTGFGPYRIVDEVIDPSDPDSMPGTVELLQSDGTTYRAAIYFSSIEEFVFV
ncbi:hypothetical protein DS909_03135 [Phaeobacter gallaeciensis]|uniref:Tandem-95 repeat protein n=1 Tax=Phaeobacter gallaeciensis TaxID=60890 RepID=A0A366X876_9RHOB|nr:Ig-like domain-containing protein [Phaeobacter gallaeciensis]RBW60857.1 hypothetical protein DS909_03135 [Phaeobacter gallaeciensis]